jgi:hypothetical protein
LPACKIRRSNSRKPEDGDDVPPGDVKQKALPADAPNAGADVAPKLNDELEGDDKPKAAGAATAAEAAAAAVTPNTGGLDDGDDVPPGDVTQKALPADAPNAGADVAPKVSDEPEDDAKPRAAGAAASAEAAAAAVTPKTGPAPA